MVPSNREIASHQIETVAKGIKKNLAAVVYSPRRLVQSAFLALAINGSVLALNAPTSEASASSVSQPDTTGLKSTDPNCFGFEVPAGAGIFGAMEMKATRDYVLVDSAGKPIRNITDELPTSTTVYDKLSDLDNSVIGTVQGLPATYTDYSVVPVGGGSQKYIRTNYPVGQDQTDGYWLEKGARGNPNEYDSIGGRFVFTANRIDGDVEVDTACGNKVMKPGFDVEKSQVFAGGRLSRVGNAIQRIANHCVFFDHMTWVVRVTEQKQPEAPAPVVTPTPEQPTITPSQMPIRQTPGSYNVQMPLR